MRFFHRFSSVNYKFFALVNGIIISCKKKNFAKHLEYFEKYSYVLSDVRLKESSEKYPNKIWQLWLQGEDNMPPIVKKCTDSVKKYHGENVILLTKATLKNYVELPDYIEEKHKKGIISHAHYSDIIRLSLLAKYGGCWIDSTVLLTDKIPQEILNSNFFSFKTLYSDNLKFIKTIEQFKIFSNYVNKVIPIESSYFLAAKPKNILINSVLQLLLEFWKKEDKLVDYLMIDKMFILAVLGNDDCKKEYMKMPDYYIENVLLLKGALFEKYSKDLYDNIVKISSIHKLSYKNLHRNPYKDSLLNYLLANEM